MWLQKKASACKWLSGKCWVVASRTKSIWIIVADHVMCPYAQRHLLHICHARRWSKSHQSRALAGRVSFHLHYTRRCARIRNNLRLRFICLISDLDRAERCASSILPAHISPKCDPNASWEFDILFRSHTPTPRCVNFVCKGDIWESEFCHAKAHACYQLQTRLMLGVCSRAIGME